MHQEPYHFYGGYTKYWYKKFLLENNFEDLNIESNGSLHTTYFALGSTIFKSFLEAILNNNNLLHKLIALISLIIFAPVFLILNPIFCFFGKVFISKKVSQQAIMFLQKKYCEISTESR